MSKIFETFKTELGTIYHADCLYVVKTIPDNSIQMVLTDPPYGHNNNNNGDLISRREAALGKGDYIPERDNIPILNDGKEANEIIKQLIPEFNRILESGCCCCCCGGGGPDPMFARWSLMFDEIMEFKQMVIWDKGPMGMGWHYRRSYETVLVSMKKGDKCRWYDTTDKIENIIRNIRKIIPQKTDHPTPKPIELMMHFINLHTKKGDTVFEPFLGGGTTAVACELLGRKYIAVELDKKFFDMSVKRIQTEANQMKLI